MQKLQIHLWFDTQAREAASFYVSLFEGSRIDGGYDIPDTPSGTAQTVSFTLAGLQMQAISAGPYFSINPSISLCVMTQDSQEVDRLWAALSAGGEALMPLDSYPFSSRYGWLKDRYGLTWQLMHTDQAVTQKIVPNLLFSGQAAGHAEEALRRYASLLEGSQIHFISHYTPGEAVNPKARVNYALATLAGTQFSAMDNAMTDDIPFNEAISIMVNCGDQAEIDRLWSALSAQPEAEQCGWLKDEFGLSWQIVPSEMDALMLKPDGSIDAKVSQAMLGMKKLDIEGLRAAKE